MQNGIQTYLKSEGEFLSTDGKNLIHYYMYEPLQEVLQEKKLTVPLGILQISHGMCEHIERYEEFAEFLCGQGFLVCGNDHLGHGRTVTDPDDYGFFGEKDGWTYLYQDLHILTLLMKRDHPNLPYFLFGHSMGSFIARIYITAFERELNGCILCGSSGGEIMGGVGLRLSEAMISREGSHYRSEKLTELMFGQYCRKIPDRVSDSDWISRDREIVKKYREDPACTFVFTAAGYRDLITMLGQVSKQEWAGQVPNQLPVFLIAGEADPVGDYGKGVEKVFHRLADAGLTDVSLKLYGGARHELLNEINRAEVYEDIFHWISRRISDNQNRG